MTTTVYIGGHDFIVQYDHTPEEKGSRDCFGLQLEPDTEESLDINTIFMGVKEVKALLYEEACDLFDNIEAQVWEKIREGEV